MPLQVSSNVPLAVSQLQFIAFEAQNNTYLAM